MRRHLLLVLLALPLAGCVIPTDPIRLAAQGPGTHQQMTAAGRALAEGERIALVIWDTQLDPDRLHRCIAEGMRARLPSPGPAVVALDSASAGRLWTGVPGDPTLDLPEEMAEFGVEWAVVVRDASTRVATPDNSFGGGGGGVGGYVGERVDYSLTLQAAILDLRGRRRLGRAAAFYAARGGGGIAAGIVAGGGIALPFVLPIIRVPAGTTALAICNAFGRAIGDALVSATTPPAERPAEAEASERPLP